MSDGAQFTTLCVGCAVDAISLALENGYTPPERLLLRLRVWLTTVQLEQSEIDLIRSRVRRGILEEPPPLEDDIEHASIGMSVTKRMQRRMHVHAKKRGITVSAWIRAAIFTALQRESEAEAEAIENPEADRR